MIFGMIKDTVTVKSTGNRENERKKYKDDDGSVCRLHGVNKRTLHYYDSIGLFSPEEKGENHYRYYGAAQSLDFEYIRMLKELNMSIEEILEYRKSPGSRKFLALAEQKLEEIDREIRKLKQTRRVLEGKKAGAFV